MNQSKWQTMDGNTAAAYISYAFTDVATIYPITPSSGMAESVDEWAAAGRKNIFGNAVTIREMQSEGGAAGAMHGSLQGGALTSTYTASQGLLLMLPNMYKIAGELLPGVFHVSARSLASNALSIFGDHQDVMSARQTGVQIIASANVQECMDLGAVSHLSAIRSRIPALHFFDGFRTSHELRKIELLPYEEMSRLIDWDAVRAFRQHSLNPDAPVLRGTTQNPDIFFQMREAVNPFYQSIPQTVQHYMDRINLLTGRNYKLFNYYGEDDAENVIIAMGSSCDVIRETIEYFNDRGGKYGLLQVHLYRPFSEEHFLDALPNTVRRIAVLDRTKEPGAAGQPLYLDVRNAFYGNQRQPLIVGGRYGLASKDFTPADVMAVFQNLERETPENDFTVGILDDVTGASLPVYSEDFDSAPEGTVSCKFWGLGSDGTVSANKSTIKIIGDNTDRFVQAYFAYDSKKSGGLTVSHLRFGQKEIRSSYSVSQADFVACHNQSYVHMYDMLTDLKPGGKFLLNCVWTAEELETALPAAFRRGLAEKNASLYLINGYDKAKELGMSNRINMIMQAAFFHITDMLPRDAATARMKEAVRKNFARLGQDVVERNCNAIDAGFEAVVPVEIPAHWKEVAIEEPSGRTEAEDFVNRILHPMNRQEGDRLPVSAFNGMEDGTFPTGTTKYEKRGISLTAPRWLSEHCIQCNQCSFVCAHAALRPFLLDEKQLDGAPDGFPHTDAKGDKEGRRYHMALSPLDCTGCGNCVNICPAKTKALAMTPVADMKTELDGWEFAKNLRPASISTEQRKTVKGSQFLQPLMEFSGACAGCGETPYAKLVTQLFGDRMVVSNSAGCATVWGGSAPAIPYTKDHLGHGPAWGFSLFEDNAEYGYGMRLGYTSIREGIAAKVSRLLEENPEPGLRAAAQNWLDHMEDSEGTRERADEFAKQLESGAGDPSLEEILSLRCYFPKRSNWVFGGDGWAYDIGYGGLDHVLASGEDVNILVFDTEVYSNTGGQFSKSTPAAAVAKFAAAGKRTRKKDLGMMAMSYGNVYVAQVAMGADKAQTLKAMLEAESHPGPSLIICYAPCVNHGIRGGMSQSQLQQKRAVDAGYWALYRHNPALKAEGRNPFVLDSKDPTADFAEFLRSEVRYRSLEENDLALAGKLFAQCCEDAMERLDQYRRLHKGG